ncbi:UbiH/UbiF family hydroxylase [Roseivivax sp. CAU 1761]
MTLTRTDILISGGGIAGLAAAAALGHAGLRVLCVDPAPPPPEDDAGPGADLRSTAFLQPARDFLDRIGLWARLAPHATPLQVMRVVDAGARGAPVVKSFDAADISDRPFGWNLPNRVIRRELIAALADLPGVTHRQGVATTGLLARSAEARVGLDDGTRVAARLVVAADGRHSPMRRAAGIGVRTTRFGQKALAFAVTHAEPHHNVSTEIHRSGGPFTLVPLPDRAGKPCSAIVWMEDGPRAEALMALDGPEFERAMTERSCGLYGPLELASPRSIWPIVAQEAERLTGERLALVAEAAHVLPPIGAQGLNQSLHDIAALSEAVTAAPADPGASPVLDAYARARRGDIRLRLAGIGALNRISRADSAWLHDLRAAGLSLLHDVTPVRQALMRLGLGAGS